MTQTLIGTPAPTLEEIQKLLRENPLVPLRQMLTNEQIYSACRKAQYDFRQRLLDPVVTVFHFLLQAIQREESFAATFPTLTAPLLSTFHVTSVQLNSSATSQARSRLPKNVLEELVAESCPGDAEPVFEYWKGMRLLALDCATLSMPSEEDLFKYFGRPRARKTTMRFPLATMSTLLAVGTSLILDNNFGPYDRGEHQTARPLLNQVGKGDLLLVDRHFLAVPRVRGCARKALTS